jgi:hypothetical protein
MFNWLWRFSLRYITQYYTDWTYFYIDSVINGQDGQLQTNLSDSRVAVQYTVTSAARDSNE